MPAAPVKCGGSGQSPLAAANEYARRSRLGIEEQSLEAQRPPWPAAPGEQLTPGDRAGEHLVLGLGDADEPDRRGLRAQRQHQLAAAGDGEVDHRETRLEALCVGLWLV